MKTLNGDIIQARLAMLLDLRMMTAKKCHESCLRDFEGAMARGASREELRILAMEIARYTIEADLLEALKIEIEETLAVEPVLSDLLLQ